MLLTPGPTNTSDSVKRALYCMDECPREKTFMDVLREVHERLDSYAYVEGFSPTAVLFSGSGSLAVESMLMDLLRKPKHRLLVLVNGSYGQQMRDVASCYGAADQVVSVEFSGAINYAQVRGILANAEVPFTHVGVVHHETSTGRVNWLELVSTTAADFGVELVVDAVSSFGGIPINFLANRIAYLATTSCKCLHGPPGLGIVFVHPQYLELEEESPYSPMYLNLQSQFRSYWKTGQMRHTPPVQVVRGFLEALKEYEDEGGCYSRYAKYRELFGRLQEGMKARGFVPLLEDAEQSSITVAYKFLDNHRFTWETFHDRLLDRGYTIYPSCLPDQPEVFRLSVLGQISLGSIDMFLRVVSLVLKSMGI